MRKLCIILDEWKSNRVFIETELRLLLQTYDVTVITNDRVDEQWAHVHFCTYSRPKRVALLGQVLGGIVRFLCDKIAWAELKIVMKSNSQVGKKISEVVRFYVNAQLFFDFLCSKGCLRKEDNTIFYFYWNFWKCFAITNHREQYPYIKVISRIHGYDLYTEQIPSDYQPFKKAMDSKLDNLVFVADHGMKYYFHTFSIERQKRHLLYYLGTENAYGLCTSSEDGILRMVSCSALVQVKRVELIVKGLSEVQKTEIHWTHFGDGELRQQIEGLADKLLSKKDNIKFCFRGYVDNKNILEFYRDNSVDLFVTTSASEGNPVSVFEAMSFGIPIMATGINNLPHLLEGNGIILSENPMPTEIGKAIKVFIDMSAEEKKNMRQMARDKWERNYVATENYERFVEEVINVL